MINGPSGPKSGRKQPPLGAPTLTANENARQSSTPTGPPLPPQPKVWAGSDANPQLQTIESIRGVDRCNTAFSKSRRRR